MSTSWIEAWTLRATCEQQTNIRALNQSRQRGKIYSCTTDTGRWWHPRVSTGPWAIHVGKGRWAGPWPGRCELELMRERMLDCEPEIGRWTGRWTRQIMLDLRQDVKQEAGRCGGLGCRKVQRMDVPQN